MNGRPLRSAWERSPRTVRIPRANKLSSTKPTISAGSRPLGLSRRLSIFVARRPGAISSKSMSKLAGTQVLAVGWRVTGTSLSGIRPKGVEPPPPARRIVSLQRDKASDGARHLGTSLYHRYSYRGTGFASRNRRLSRRIIRSSGRGHRRARIVLRREIERLPQVFDPATGGGPSASGLPVVRRAVPGGFAPDGMRRRSQPPSQA